MADSTAQESASLADNPAQDSITMAQLKQFVGASKQKQEPVHFQYADMDTLSAEIDEFYGYNEIKSLIDNRDNFMGNYDGGWQTTAVSEREAYAEYLLDLLDHKSDSSRHSGAQQLIYIAQGAYTEVTDEDNHLDWILKNNKMLRKLGALQIYYDALRSACFKVLNQPAVANEIEALITLLYMLVISHEDDADFVNELAAADPSMTVFLYDQICIRPSKDQPYPLKKMLLLLWKVLRTTLGGTADFPRLKDITRRMIGGLPMNNGELTQKTDPVDYLFYQSEMSQKYPAYIPSTSATLPGCPVPIATIADVLQAKPAISGSQNSQKSSSGNNGSGGKHGGKGTNNGLNSNGTLPFIFPSSSMRKSTPRSILEAEDLFNKNMYISPSTLQIFQEKKLMTDRRYRSALDVHDQDSGRALEYRKPASIRSKTKHQRRSLRRGARGHGGQGDDDGDDEADDASEAEDASDLETSRNSRDSASAAAMTGTQSVSEEEREQIERIEHIYREIVPRMAQIQVTLLKTLLVCIKISGVSAAKENAQAESEGKEPVDSFTRANDIREHEIMAKAVSSILLLQLQHFKLYHILAFNYVCQLLVDSNCLLLLLKIFGNAENPGNIHTKNEVEEYNFFKYCGIIRKTTAGWPNQPEEAERARQAILAGAVADLGDPIPANYVCRRNMFAIINLLRVLQKLTKHKTHRVLLLVQYKSSAILKRLLKINHPDLQRYVYKTLKSQVPFLGRKWRSSHMKVITGIYIYCRSNLRDDWISGADVEKDLEEALPAEQQLRNLIRHYHDRVHPSALVPDPGSAQAKNNGSSGGSNQHTGPKYDWQEMYEAHASIPDVGEVGQHRQHHHHRGRSSGGHHSASRSDGEESVKSTSSHHSSASHGSIGSSSSADRRRELVMSDIELEPGFEENYEEWLEAEVFGKGHSSVSPILDLPPFKPNDYYLDDQPSVPFLRTPGDGSGWDTPAVMPSDDEWEGPRYGMGGAFNFSQFEGEDLFQQIQWTPNRWGQNADVEEQYYLDDVSEYGNSKVYYARGGPVVDADTGVDLATSQGVEGGGSQEGSQGYVEGSEYSASVATGANQQALGRRRPRPLRVRKSDMGTEWIEENDKEEVMHAYGPPPTPHIVEPGELNEP